MKRKGGGGVRPGMRVARNGGAVRGGRAGTSQAQSRQRQSCSPAVDTLSSVRYARDGSAGRKIMVGQAMGSGRAEAKSSQGLVIRRGRARVGMPSLPARPYRPVSGN